MPLHAACRYYSPNSPAAIRSNHGNQITTCTRLAKNCPAGFSYATTLSANNPRWMTIFINDLFDFFWLYTVPGNVFNVVLIPLRLQLPELHRVKLAQGNAGFESLTYSVLSIGGEEMGTFYFLLRNGFRYATSGACPTTARALVDEICYQIVNRSNARQEVFRKKRRHLMDQRIGFSTLQLSLAEASLRSRGRPREQCEK